MLAGMLKEHVARQQLHKEMQEKRKNEAIVAVHELSNAVVDHLNLRISYAYNNQKRLDIECKKLEKNGANLAKQAEQWTTVVDSFNSAFKEIGDVESWTKAVANDMELIAEVLDEVKNFRT